MGARNSAQLRLMSLFVAAMCSGCGDSNTPRPPTSPTPTPSIPPIAGNYIVTITALPPESCIDGNGRQIGLTLGSAEGHACDELYNACGVLTQSGDSVTMVGRSLVKVINLTGTLTGITLTFKLDGVAHNPGSGDTRVNGTGTAMVQQDRVSGTFTGDLIHIPKAFNPIVTWCVGRQHSLLLTRVPWDP
jgi:hypothetical protein